MKHLKGSPNRVDGPKGRSGSLGPARDLSASKETAHVWRHG